MWNLRKRNIMKSKALAIGETFILAAEIIVVLIAALIAAIGAGAGTIIQRLKER